MADDANPPGPMRLPPADVPAEAADRILTRRQIRQGVEAGDVLITREQVPRVNPRPLSAVPQWWYRLTVAGELAPGRVFTSFDHAASEAEEIAAKQRTRVIYLDRDDSSVLVDYRSTNGSTRGTTR